MDHLKPILPVALWLVVCSYIGGIWYLSNQGAAVTRKVDAAGVSDFAAHSILFGGLSLCVFLAMWATWPQKPWIWFAAISVAGAFTYGLVDEFHQSFNPQRGADVGDVLANLAGAAGVQVVIAVIMRLRRG